MGIITANGEIQKIEDRAVTPFLGSIGGEASYEAADIVADAVIEALALPPDYPYMQRLHGLCMAVAQNAAELAFLTNNLPRVDDFTKETVAANNVLLDFGLDELTVGRYLGVGKDNWDRQGYWERSSIEFLITGLSHEENESPELPSQEVLDFLDQSGVITLGISRALRESITQGYVLGRSGDAVNFDSQAAYIARHGGYGRGVRGVVAERSLLEAEQLREREQNVVSFLSKLAMAE